MSARSPLPKPSPLSEALIGPLTRAHREGGLGLSILLCSMAVLTTSVIAPRGVISYSLAGFGMALLTVITWGYVTKEILPIQRARAAVEDRAETIDAVQETAREMTALALRFDSLANRHAASIALEIASLRDILDGTKEASALRKFPVFSRLSNSRFLSEADRISESIVEATAEAEMIIEDIEEALITSNHRLLRKYLEQVSGVRSRIDELMKSS